MSKFGNSYFMGVCALAMTMIAAQVAQKKVDTTRQLAADELANRPIGAAKAYLILGVVKERAQVTAQFVGAQDMFCNVITFTSLAKHPPHVITLCSVFPPRPQ